MPEKSFAELKADLQRRKFSPVIFLQGTEDFFIDDLSAWIEQNALPEEQKSFNQTVLYGRDVSVKEVINASRRYPMMAEYQLVMVKEAQNLINIEDLCVYIDQALPSTILAIAYKGKTLDKRKKLYKSIVSAGVLFTSDKVKDYKIPEWIQQYTTAQGFTMSVKTSQVLYNCLGSDLNKISNEIQKLAINVPKGSEITEEHIEQYIGISRDYNIFELQMAIAKKDALKSYQIVNYFGNNPKGADFSFVVLSGMLYGFFNRLYLLHHIKSKSNQEKASILGVNPYFLNDYETSIRLFSLARVKNCIRILLEFDLRSKGFGTTIDEGELMQEMIFRLINT